MHPLKPFVRTVSYTAIVAICAACRTGTPALTSAPVPAAAAARQVVATASHRALSIDDLAAAASASDVVFFGEEHTDPDTHRAEFELLEAIGKRRNDVILSLEMFERDVQGPLDDYLAGRLPEAEFLARSRPWPRYADDYRRMVELAKARGWPVVAANVPRPIASAVGRHGLDALDSLPPNERAFAARDLICPDDDYKRRFFEEMKGHSSGSAAPSPGDTLPTAVAQRFYIAQCVKDETMGESIASARLQHGRGSLVVHYDGSFHSDYAAGTAERLKRRAPSARTLVITAIPVASPATEAVKDAKRADYVIFTKAAAKPTTPP